MALAEGLANPHAPISIGDPRRIWDEHILDSLSPLLSDTTAALLAEASSLADLGAGAGLPGLVLALCLPETEVELIESVGRKCEFADRMIDQIGISNATTLPHRSEEVSARHEPGPGEGPASGPLRREHYDVVCARAVSSLSTTAELASPLLREGGSLLAWRGRRDFAEERDFEAVTGRMALGEHQVWETAPYPGSRNRHLHLIRKSGPTPEKLPRRPGMAAKRPLGAS